MLTRRLASNVTGQEDLEYLRDHTDYGLEEMDVVSLSEFDHRSSLIRLSRA